MNDFLSRLVQRTRGEAGTVRPASHAVIAPDPGGAAWDEQVAVREAPALARPTHTTLPAVVAHPPAPRASPIQQLLEHNEFEHPVEMRAEPKSAPSHGGPADMADATRGDSVRDLPPLAETQFLQRASARVEAHQHQDRALPGDARIAVARISAAHAATPRSTPTEAAARALGPIASEPMTAPAQARSPATTTPAALAPVLRVTGIASTIVTELSAPTTQTVPEPRPNERTVERSTRGPALATSALAVPLNSSLLSTSIPSPTRGSRLDARLRGLPLPEASEPDALQEHATTVEVSIGRIEVRLPTRARADGDPPSLTPRRATVGLNEYLNHRDNGKSR